MKKTLTLLLTVLFCAMQLSVFPEGDTELTVKEYLDKALSPEEGRKIVYNDSAKLLTVTDTVANHKVIKRLIEQFEVGQKQVAIEARFVEVDVTNLDELGIQWDFYQHGVGNRDVNLQKAKSFFAQPQINEPGVNHTNPEYQGVHWNDSATIDFPKAGILAGEFMMGRVTGLTGNYIYARLRALDQQGKTNLLSAPKVTTVSGQMANIQVTRVYPYVSDFTLENIGTAEYPIWTYKLTIAEKPVGISLEVTPYVSEGSNTITLDLHPEVSVLKAQIRISNLTGFGDTSGTPIISADLGWPVIDVRTTQTSIAIDSGETIILGGMLKENETTSKKKIPVIGDIPLLGKAFQYDYKSIEKKNLLIFITASIITADGEVVR